MKVDIRFVHKISPSDTDVRTGVCLEDIWTSFEPTTWARCLRFAGVLPAGTQVRELRRDTCPDTGLDRVLVFPRNAPHSTTGWHCLQIKRAK
jgi:hypothetical protein